MEQKTGISHFAQVPNRVPRCATPSDSAKTAVSAAYGMCQKGCTLDVTGPYFRNRALYAAIV